MKKLGLKKIKMVERHAHNHSLKNEPSFKRRTAFVTTAFVTRLALGTLICGLLFTSCGDKKTKTEKTSGTKADSNVISVSVDEDNSSGKKVIKLVGRKMNEMVIENGKVSFNSMDAFFEPDLDAVEMPDAKLGAKEKSKVIAGSDGKETTSAIPGVRKLTEYLTKYSTKRKELKAYKAAIADEEITDNHPEIEFKVEDWGPGHRVVSEAEFPTFYVVFSKPVKSLAALDKPDSAAEVLSISPALKGTYHWYGTKHVSFEAEEAADPSQVYTVSISPELTDIYGNKIKGDTDFTTVAEAIEIQNLYGGYIKEDQCAYDRNSGALPPYENSFFIRTNYKLKPEVVADNLQVEVGGKRYTFNVEGDFTDKTFSWWRNYPSYDVDKGTTNSFVVKINGTIPHNQKVVAKINGKTGGSYYTLLPFTVTNADEYTNYTDGDKGNPFSIRFSQTPDEKTILDNIIFDLDYKLTKDNFEVNGTRVTFYNLPLEFNTSYSYVIKNGLKDIYGQSLSEGIIDSLLGGRKYTFKTKPVKSYVKYLDYGAKMLEAQYPHKLLYEYQNIYDGSYYNLEKVENPLYISSSKEIPQNPTYIEPGTKDVRHFQEVDLNPLLTNGYGFVKFSANTRVQEFDYWSHKETIEDDRNLMTVQVTDLGITSRLGINKAVVMVRSLSTGKPVANAKVYILQNAQDHNDSPVSRMIASGTTDKNGLAVIKYTESQIVQYENSIKYSYEDYISVYVENGDDKAIYTPASHNMWRENVNTGNRFKVRTPKQRTFMFVDRGLYRPGETVTFRGIDRDQLLGELIPHTGKYGLQIKGTWWKAPSIVENIEATSSESGGFWGSFKLPDNLEPGTYQILFKRDCKYDVSDYDSPKVTFTVAEFERLKIQSGITVPSMEFKGGDSITAELSAEYLAGGSLSNADYHSTWFKEGTSFYSEDPETKAYTFAGGYTDRDYFSETSGKLNSEGKASLNCKSEKITSGIPMKYRVEATVTDVSNQSISSAASILIHPASFYIGIKRFTNYSGFAKKGSKLEFPYVLTDTKGHLLENDKTALACVNEITYTLTRDEWTMVHEQSVDNSVYTRYEMQKIEEATGTVAIQPKGNLSITPKESGSYNLVLNGKDANGNTVRVSYYFYVTGGNNFRHDSYNSESITLTPNQSQYNPGDKAELLLESELPSGDYLITVEREGIFTEEIRHFDSPANVIEIPVAANYVPVVYVAVSSYSMRHGEPTHNYGEPDLDKPKGYFGVTPLFVNPYVRSFSVDIQTSKPTYKPGEEATITLTATKNGQPFSGAELTVMAVDRGVLDLIDYHVPNPIEFFYSTYNFPLCVKGGDSRALLMDPVTYSIKNLQGGDEDSEKEDERKDFRPTAIFEPVVITDAEGKATVTFKMPDSLTTYRITAFGVKHDLFALQEDEVTVQNPINIQQVQPRKLRERDTAECGVLITNLSDSGQEVTVNLEVRTPTGNTFKDEQEGRNTIPGAAFVDGESNKKVYVASGDSTVVYFDVAAKQKGTVELVYTINSQLINEKLISPLNIEKTYVYETVTMSGSITDDQKKDSATELIAIPGFAEDGVGSLKFTLDATRLGMLGTSVNYLFSYPYGCLEQQSSKVLPLVIFGDYIDVFGLDKEVNNIKRCVLSYTNQWGKYQLANGGFPYWPDSSYDSLYVSLRIAHIYAAALKRGYTDKELGIDIIKLKSYIRSHINDKYVGDYLKAYACYIFSMMDDSSLYYQLNTLSLMKDRMSLSTIAYIGLAYQNYGSSSADSIASYIRSYLQIDERTVTVLSKDRSNMWEWYNNDTEQLALILQLLVQIDEDDQMVDRLIYTLLKNQSHGYWSNTAITSRVLEAIYTYIQERNLDNTNYKGSVNFAGKKIMEESFKGAGAKPKTLELPFEDEILAKLTKDKEEPVTFDKKGNGNLYYTVEMSYAIPDEMQAARNEGIKLNYTIVEADTGRIVNPNNADSSLITLKSGKLYKATIQVESHKNRDYLALRAPIPSGAEILDSTFVTTQSLDDEKASYSWRYRLSNKTIRDNEIQFFWDNFYSGSTSVNFTFRASRRGVYPLPPVQAECMYEPETFGRGDGYLAVIE